MAKPYSEIRGVAVAVRLKESEVSLLDEMRGFTGETRSSFLRSLLKKCAEDKNAD